MIVLSLFGGMECGRIALDRMGIVPDKYYSSEIDKHAIKEVTANYPDVIHLGDITKWRYWKIEWSKIDYLIGGSPCQGFSFAGDQLAFDDPRSALFFEFVNIMAFINEHKRLLGLPPVKFMLENVKMAKKHLTVINDHMKVDSVFINSALVCAQNRQRHYWCNWSVSQPEDRHIYLADILEYGVCDHTIMSDKFVTRQKGRKCLVKEPKAKAVNLSSMEYVKNGRQGDYINCDIDGAINGDGWHTWWEKNKEFQLMKKYSSIVNDGSTDKAVPLLARHYRNSQGNFYKIRSAAERGRGFEVRKDDKGNCLLSGGHQSRWLANDGDKYRKLTVVECCRLQGVPDNYFKVSSNTQAYKMLGNGWQVDTIIHIFEQEINR